MCEISLQNYYFFLNYANLFCKKAAHSDVSRSCGIIHGYARIRNPRLPRFLFGGGMVTLRYKLLFSGSMNRHIYLLRPGNPFGIDLRCGLGIVAAYRVEIVIDGFVGLVGQ